MLGDAECDEEECGHCEEETVPGWTAATDALLQFWDLRVVIIVCGEKVRERGERVILFQRTVILQFYC